jgi:hypothetical protein
MEVEHVEKLQISHEIFPCLSIILRMDRVGSRNSSSKEANPNAVIYYLENCDYSLVLCGICDT